MLITSTVEICIQQPGRVLRRNGLITIWCVSVSGSRDYQRFLKFLHVDIQSTGHTLSRPWSRQLNDVMSEIECAQLHSELFRRRHSTRQLHSLFALALVFSVLIVDRNVTSTKCHESRAEQLQPKLSRHTQQLHTCYFKGICTICREIVDWLLLYNWKLDDSRH